MRRLCQLAGLLLLLRVLLGEELVVLEYFTNVHITEVNKARETCEMRGGELAGHGIDVNDWDNYLITADLEIDVLMDTYFAVSIARDSNGVWRYADGHAIDMTSSIALTLREYNNSVTPQPDYDCALWSPWEPFFIPSKCSEDHAFVCRKPVLTETECSMELTQDTGFAGRWSGHIEILYDVDESTCMNACSQKVNDTQGGVPCWAAEYHKALGRCMLLRSTDQPTIIPELVSDTDKVIGLKSCKTVASFPEDTCSVLCKCDTTREVIVFPQSAEELEIFKEQVTEQTKRELSVPTKNLSASVRKKTSATDERSTSTGMGALGVTMITMVFGGLVALDLTSFFSAVKSSLAPFQPVRTGKTTEI